MRVHTAGPKAPALSEAAAPFALSAVYFCVCVYNCTDQKCSQPQRLNLTVTAKSQIPTACVKEQQETNSVLDAECKGRDPETESMELGCCAARVYLEVAYRSSVLLQSGTGVYYDFLPRCLFGGRSRDSSSRKCNTRACCRSEGANVF